ncbi:MAG: sugar kinase [Planctomycetes bacterium]|nr:sugar kinase [Planctomycetota bacterium]MCP4770832.1 sugar kinase [Planctomycetota bacterium]MCP4860214.1 sugar kinase [Planctomycetota bacterium]
MSLAVFGSVGLDDISTPSGEVKGVIGGSAVYFSLAASLFTDVRLAANVGGDFPESAWTTLRERGTDLTGLQLFADRQTFRWSGKYQGDMNEAQTLNTELNVLVEQPLVPESYRDSRYLFLANMSPDTQLEILEQFPRAVAFADTMNLWIDTSRENLERLMSLVYGLVLNDGEARMLTGEHNLLKAGAKLQQMGPDVIVIKKGEHGCFLFTPDGRFGLPAYPVENVVDPTGAGDSFAGGMMGALAEMENFSMDALRRAMAYGTVCASLTVEKFSTGGLEESTRHVVNERYNEFREFLRFS